MRMPRHRKPPATKRQPAVVEETAESGAFRGPSEVERRSRPRCPFIKEWGGVVPELASRPSTFAISAAWVERATRRCDPRRGASLGRAPPVTQGPPDWWARLLVGCNRFAKGRGPAARLACRLVPPSHSSRPGTLNHSSLQNGELPMPAVVLGRLRWTTRACISSNRPGHYQLFEPYPWTMAAGEAYDKVCQAPGFSDNSPAGRSSNRLARPPANDRAVRLARHTRLTHCRSERSTSQGRSRFSASAGIKTAVLRLVRGSGQAGEDRVASFRSRKSPTSAAKLSSAFVVTTLVEFARSRAARPLSGRKSIGVGRAAVSAQQPACARGSHVSTDSRREIADLFLPSLELLYRQTPR